MTGNNTVTINLKDYDGIVSVFNTRQPLKFIASKFAVFDRRTHKVSFKFAADDFAHLPERDFHLHFGDRQRSSRRDRDGEKVEDALPSPATGKQSRCAYLQQNYPEVAKVVHGWC